MRNKKGVTGLIVTLMFFMPLTACEYERNIESSEGRTEIDRNLGVNDQVEEGLRETGEDINQGLERAGNELGEGLENLGQEMQNENNR